MSTFSHNFKLEHLAVVKEGYAKVITLFFIGNLNHFKFYAEVMNEVFAYSSFLISKKKN